MRRSAGLPLRAVARRMGLSLPTIRRYVRSGRIHATLEPGPFGMQWEVSEEELGRLCSELIQVLDPDHCKPDQRSDSTRRRTDQASLCPVQPHRFRIDLIHAKFRAPDSTRPARVRTLVFVRRWPTGGGAGRSFGASWHTSPNPWSPAERPVLRRTKSNPPKRRFGDAHRSWPRLGTWWIASGQRRPAWRRRYRPCASACARQNRR